ncbi:MAG: hypothetical protein ABSD27_08760 [Bryobacteraceae bacterium]|jgi:dienelactone hydrolase
MARALAMVCVLGALAAVSPAADVTAGKIIDSIRCREDPQQTYSLYVPSYYAPNRLWPVLYCFDPLARGRWPVERFRVGAEKYGYIVVGSNNSRNGPLGPSLAALRAMWRDTHDWLAIDDHRVYSAGYSGGTTLSLSVARSSGQFRGVVLTGGVNLAAILKPDGRRVAIFGAAGLDDFNYFEMQALDAAASRLGLPRRLEIFPGGHVWLPEGLASMALGWLELEAMRGGARPRDEKLIDQLLAEFTQRARAAETAGDLLAAQRAYASLASDFAGLRPTESYAARAAELDGAREVKQARGRERREEADLNRLTAELMQAAYQAAGNGDRTEFRQTVNMLRRDAPPQNQSSAGRTARRSLASAALQARLARLDLLEKKQYAQAAAWLELEAIIQPNQPMIHGELARAYALSGERKRAAQAFRRALENGFGYVLFFAGPAR